MPIFETFFKRQKKLRGDVPDVFVYDTLPPALRVQIVQIMHEILGDDVAYNDHYGRGAWIQDAYKTIVNVLRREMGVFKLPGTDSYNENYLYEITNFILKEKDVEQCLSAVEIVCRLIENTASKFDYRYFQNAADVSKEAIDEINARFKENGVGYEYDSEILRIDSQLIHAEVIKPALSLLQDNHYAGAQDEFLKAYSHYRKGANKEAMNEALKAFESVMKAICEKRKWTFQKTDTAAKLIQVLLDHGLIPVFWQSHFTALRTTLETGVPTGRNKLSGHGQGTSQTVVPDHLASYILNMTASAIVFLAKSEQALS
ncbi:STM4504/CBY_0614 family protein [Mesorhizobium caraganae]|uniref:STM4504/CBY_0614 family protein n=1 Tax=Mesorhizobium caraganae TaxID=483206 RepID=UPI001781B4C8|nr:hypothetical protein [Mesorhizobium caraganae]